MIALKGGRSYALITVTLLCLAISGCQLERQPRPVEPVVETPVVDVQAIERLQPGQQVMINRERRVVGIVVGRDEQGRPLLKVPPGVFGGMRPDYRTIADVTPGSVIRFGPGAGDVAVDIGNGWVYLGDQPPTPDALEPDRVQWLSHLFSRQGVIREAPRSVRPGEGGGPHCEAGFELQVWIGGMQCLRLAPAATEGGPEDERTRAYALAIEPDGVLTNPSAPPPLPATPHWWDDPTQVDLEIHYDFNRDGQADLVVPSQGSAREPHLTGYILPPGPVEEPSLIARVQGFINDLIYRLPLP